MKNHKKDFEDIYIPHERVDQVIEEAIQRAKQKTRTKYRIKIVGITATFMLFLMSTGFVSTSMANVLTNIPYIGSVFEHFTESGLQNAPKDEVLVINDAIISNKGTSIKVQEVFYDENSINIGYIMSTKEGNPPSLFLNLSYNDTPILGGGNAFIQNLGDGVYYYLNQHYYEGELPSDFDLEISFFENFDKKPNFQFTAPISKSTDEKNQTKTIIKSVTNHKETLMVNNITFTPVSIKMEYKYIYPSKNNQHQIQLIDIHGNILKPHSFGGSNTEMDGICIEDNVAIFNTVQDFSQIVKIQLINQNGETMDLTIGE